MNPIAAALQRSRPGNIANLINAVRDPDAMYNQLMQTNPQFRNFVETNRGKSPDQIAREHGIDLSSIMK